MMPGIRMPSAVEEENAGPSPPPTQTQTQPATTVCHKHTDAVWFLPAPR